MPGFVTRNTEWGRNVTHTHTELHTLTYVPDLPRRAHIHMLVYTRTCARVYTHTHTHGCTHQQTELLCMFFYLQKKEHLTVLERGGPVRSGWSSCSIPSPVITSIHVVLFFVVFRFHCVLVFWGAVSRAVSARASGSVDSALPVMLSLMRVCCYANENLNFLSVQGFGFNLRPPSFPPHNQGESPVEEESCVGHHEHQVMQTCSE